MKTAGETFPRVRLVHLRRASTETIFPVLPLTWGWKTSVSSFLSSAIPKSASKAKIVSGQCAGIRMPHGVGSSVRHGFPGTQRGPAEQFGHRVPIPGRNRQTRVCVQRHFNSVDKVATRIYGTPDCLREGSSNLDGTIRY